MPAENCGHEILSKEECPEDWGTRLHGLDRDVLKKEHREMGQKDYLFKLCLQGYI